MDSSNVGTELGELFQYKGLDLVDSNQSVRRWAWCILSLSSCHQTLRFFCSPHCFPTSFNVIRPSKEQGCASWGHCNMCAVVSTALPQT